MEHHLPYSFEFTASSRPFALRMLVRLSTPPLTTAPRRLRKGDAQACFHEFWWRYPEHVRVWVRAAIRAGAGGMSSKAAARVADSEVERWREVQMRYAAKPHSPPAPTEQPATALMPAPMPRIRTL